MTAIRVLPHPEALAEAAARQFVEHAQAAIDARGRAAISLSGGSTPREMYRRLAGPPLIDQVDWDKVLIFFGDERCVPPDDVGSNFRMAEETLLKSVPLPKDQIHRMRGELPPQEAATDYERQLQQVYGHEPPRLDIVLLGMGDNGHGRVPVLWHWTQDDPLLATAVS